MADFLDPVKVDPKHYVLEFENEQVRVLRVKYGPREKSVMHEHYPGLRVFLTDEHVRFRFPDGTTQDVHAKAGETMWCAPSKHHPENLSDNPLHLIVVELKSRA